MKKLFKAVMMASALLCLVLGIAACSKKHEHAYSPDWTQSETAHWHAATCGHDLKADEAAHEYENGECTICHYHHQNHTVSDYIQAEETHSGKCSVCEAAVSGAHEYENGVCTVCGYEHEDHEYENGVCTVCDYKHTDHVYTTYAKTDEGHSGTCTVCGAPMSEEHNYVNGLCTVCDYAHTNHVYENGVCTVCDYEHTDHQFGAYTKSDKDHTRACSVCGKTETGSHTYLNGVCTACEYVHVKHVYGEGDVCTVCGAEKQLFTKDEEGEKIYFGEYPQTLVDDPTLTAALEQEAGKKPTASDQGNWTSYGYYYSGAVTDYMWYIDLSYQGFRYRGVYFTDYRPASATGDSMSDKHQQLNGYNANTVYWFQYEPIEWRILEEKDGAAFLVANIVLDSRQFYHIASDDPRDVNGQQVYGNNYKESDIRAWLNAAFYETAFGASEQAIVKWTTVDNSLATVQSYSDSVPNLFTCESTRDKVFLLSYQEAMAGYGFSAATRQFKSTDYAKAQGVKVSKANASTGNSEWWLRSPDFHNGASVCGVGFEGTRIYEWVSQTFEGVVPALWIRIDGTQEPSDGGQQDVIYTMSADGKKIYFGEYPQTLISETNDPDSSLRHSLGIAAGSEPTSSDAGKWTDYRYYRSWEIRTGIMWYQDVEYGGSRYRGVYINEYRASATDGLVGNTNSTQAQYGYQLKTVYWFRYEPIAWRILDQTDGAAFLMSEIALDSQQYYHDAYQYMDKTFYPNNYEKSDIRAWLNSTFGDTAFTEAQRNAIRVTEVDNSAASTDESTNIYACGNTQDKVFLLSCAEAVNEQYGFKRSTDTAKMLFVTDYAKVQGVKTNGDDRCTWLLRSPRPNDGDQTWGISYTGSIETAGAWSTRSVRTTTCGVVPALWLTL